MLRILKHICKKKILFLTGSGFTVSPDFGCPSTLTLTNLIRNNNTYPIDRSILDVGGLEAGEYIFQRLCHFYSNGLRTNSCGVQEVNFETMIHLLEEAFSFFVSAHSRSHPEYRGVKPSFLNFDNTFLDDLNASIPSIISRITATDRQAEEYIRLLFYFFLHLIIQQLDAFNNDPNNRGMTSFRRFIQNKLPDRKNIKRIYTVNYDNWINKFMDYYDGFNASGDFEGEEVMRNKYSNVHYNIHGCIEWMPDINNYRVSKVFHTFDILNQAISNPTGIDREPLMATPIITGYNKMQRMKYDPYMELYYSLNKDILRTDLLVIIGYSFTDTHLNNLISQFRGKVIIVTRFAPIPHTSPLEYDPWSDEVDTFGHNVIGCLNCNIHFDGGRGSNWIESDDRRIRVWWKGIGQEFYDSWDDISDFS
jgi:hypothetical protein